jgi:CRISPR-associated protein Cmr4
MKQRLYFLLARSALHVGSGDGAGMIDLPFIREKATGLPVIPGSGVKGVLRDAHERTAESKTTEIEKAAARKDVIDLFGSDYRDDPDQSEMQSGMLAIDDAFLLCMPVRSMKGTFAWVTCPFALRRLKRSLGQTEITVPEKETHPKDYRVPQPTRNDNIIATDEILEGNGQRALLEELELISALQDDDTQAHYQWAKWLTETAVEDGQWREDLQKRFAIVSDEVFAFLTETATDVRARIRLGASGAAENKALWYEELMPADTLFWGHWNVMPVKAARLTTDKAAARVLNQPLIVGGKQTVGRGLVDFRRLPAI